MDMIRHYIIWCSRILPLLPCNCKGVYFYSETPRIILDVLPSIIESSYCTTWFSSTCRTMYPWPMAILQANELTVELRGSDDLSFKALDTWAKSCQIVCRGWHEVLWSGEKASSRMAVDVRMICLVLGSSAFPWSTLAISIYKHNPQVVESHVRAVCSWIPWTTRTDTDSTTQRALAKQSRVQSGQGVT